MRDLDHLDGAVGAQGSAHAGAGAPLLGDLDLAPLFIVADGVVAAALEATPIDAGAAGLHEVEHAQARAAQGQPLVAVALLASEERRVGKECRSRWSPCHIKKKRTEVTGLSDNIRVISIIKCYQEHTRIF